MSGSSAIYDISIQYLKRLLYQRYTLCCSERMRLHFERSLRWCLLIMVLLKTKYMKDDMQSTFLGLRNARDLRMVYLYISRMRENPLGSITISNRSNHKQT